MLCIHLFLCALASTPLCGKKNPTPRHFSPNPCRPLSATKNTVNTAFPVGKKPPRPHFTEEFFCLNSIT
jgi:hypothetical protein